MPDGEKFLGPCRSCRKQVWFLKNEATGRLAPIDPEVNEKGNVQVDLEHGVYMVLSGGLVSFPGTRHTSHFVTCPEAAQWRNRRANHG